MTRTVKLLSFALCLLFSHLFAIKTGGKQHASTDKILNQQSDNVSAAREDSAATATAEAKEEEKKDEKIEVKDQSASDTKIEEPVLGWGAWLYSFIVSTKK